MAELLAEALVREDATNPSRLAHLERENAALRRLLSASEAPGRMAQAARLAERSPVVAVAGGLMLGFLAGAVWPAARGPKRGLGR